MPASSAQKNITDDGEKIFGADLRVALGTMGRRENDRLALRDAKYTDVQETSCNKPENRYYNVRNNSYFKTPLSRTTFLHG
jgi:hypothetical protein